MTTKVKVRSSEGGGSDLHDVKGTPEVVTHKVNMAIRGKNQFVTLEVPGGKKLSLIADRIEAIWEE